MSRLAILSACFALVTTSAIAAPLPGAETKNENANANACWGQDRAFYASGAARQNLGWKNLDIKQSFPGDVGEQRQAWVDTYCEPHGPQSGQPD